MPAHLKPSCISTASAPHNVQVGTETLRICQQLVDGVVLVDNAACSAAIRDVFNETRCILEPSGALAVAGASAYLQRQGIKVRLAARPGATRNAACSPVTQDIVSETRCIQKPVWHLPLLAFSVRAQCVGDNIAARTLLQHSSMQGGEEGEYSLRKLCMTLNLTEMDTVHRAKKIMVAITSGANLNFDRLRLGWVHSWLCSHTRDHAASVTLKLTVCGAQGKTMVAITSGAFMSFAGCGSVGCTAGFAATQEAKQQVQRSS